jgi:hypothetical protein
MPSNNRYPNQTGSPILGIRRVSYWLLTGPSAPLDAIAFDDFLGIPDTWTANYAPPAPAIQIADRLGDYSYPNTVSEKTVAARNTRMRPAAADGLDRIITIDFIGPRDLAGAAAGDQAAQVGGGAGAVFVATVTPEHYWGEWVDVRELILRKARELPPPPVPAPVGGYGEGAQVAQAGTAQGHVMPRVRGKAKGRQFRQAGRAVGGVSMVKKNERELLELILLDAA